MDALELLRDQRLVPVVVIQDGIDALSLALALRDAGIASIEVTLRSEAGLPAIELIASQVPDIIVGAGSVRTSDQFQSIYEAGAKFAVSPGSSKQLIKTAKSLRLPFVPGVATASEIISLWEAGYTLQKFFPAELSGGVEMLKALSAPLPEIRFFPTGGITDTLAKKYLQLPCVQCIGGSWFVPASLLAEKRFAEISQLAADAIAATNE